MSADGRQQPDWIHDRLVERVNDAAENILNPQACAAALHRVLDICSEYERNSLRWQDQLQVPKWVPKMREGIAEALGIDPADGAVPACSHPADHRCIECDA